MPSSNSHSATSANALSIPGASTSAKRRGRSSPRRAATRPPRAPASAEGRAEPSAREAGGHGRLCGFEGLRASAARARSARRRPAAGPAGVDVDAVAFVGVSNSARARDVPGANRRHAPSIPPDSHASRRVASKMIGLPGVAGRSAPAMRGTTTSASPRLLNAPIRSAMSCADHRLVGEATITASSYGGDSAARPQRTDEAPTGVRRRVAGDRDRESLHRRLDGSRRGGRARRRVRRRRPRQRDQLTVISGTPPSSSRALGRPPRRTPKALAASSTAPTVMRLYSRLRPFRMQPMTRCTIERPSRARRRRSASAPSGGKTSVEKRWRGPASCQRLQQRRHRGPRGLPGHAGASRSRCGGSGLHAPGRSARRPGRLHSGLSAYLPGGVKPQRAQRVGQAPGSPVSQPSPRRRRRCARHRAAHAHD